MIPIRWRRWTDMAKRLVLLYSSAVKPWEADTERILGYLSSFCARGMDCESLDVAGTAEEKLDGWREEALKASMLHKQGTRRVFGTKGKGGLPYFGREVPALLVYTDSEKIPAAVFPHSESRGHERREISIEDFLKELLEGDERRSACEAG
jgi:hypothetical protein